MKALLLWIVLRALTGRREGPASVRWESAWISDAQRSEAFAPPLARYYSNVTGLTYEGRAPEIVDCAVQKVGGRINPSRGSMSFPLYGRDEWNRWETADDELRSFTAVSYTHLTLPTKRIV